MKSLTEEIEKSNVILTNRQTKVKTVKEDTQTYKQSLGVVEPETLVSIPDEIVLGICIRIIHEKKETVSASRKLHSDFAEVETFLQFLNIGDRNLSKHRGLKSTIVTKLLRELFSKLLNILFTERP